MLNFLFQSRLCNKTLPECVLWLSQSWETSSAFLILIWLWKDFCRVCWAGALKWTVIPYRVSHDYQTLWIVTVIMYTSLYCISPWERERNLSIPKKKKYILWFVQKGLLFCSNLSSIFSYSKPYLINRAQKICIHYIHIKILYAHGKLNY